MDEYYKFNLNWNDLENDFDKINNIKNNVIFNEYEYNNINNIIKKKYNKKTVIKANIYIKKKLENNIYYECPICYNNITSYFKKELLCNHILCKNCYNDWNKVCNFNNKNISCPLCRQEHK
jgi:hypothetical protein